MMHHRSTSLRRAAAILVLALGALIAPLAAGARAGAHAAPTTITVIDDHHHRLVLRGIPQRIVALAPNIVEILYAIGAGKRVVGVSSFTDYPPAAAHKPVVVTYTGANLEKIVALRPDLLVAAGIDNSYLPKLRTLHLPTIVLDPGTIPGILRDISIAGTVTGDVSGARAVVKSMQARLAAVAARLRHIHTHPRVFYELDFSNGSAYTYGQGTFGDALITLAGGYNVGRSGTLAYPQFSTEQLIAAAPEVIMLADGASARSVKQRPGFSAIPAVRDGRIYAINDDLVSRPGPRIVQGLEQLARLLHPEAFTQ